MSDQSQSMPHYLTTKEVAELLRVKERRLYELVSEGGIPHIKATGKLLFPQDELLRWLKHDAPENSQPNRPNVVAGSQDPLLEWAIRESECGLATQFDGSLSGLTAFANGNCIAASMHLPNTDKQGYNSEAIEKYCAHMPFVAVAWATRQQGLVFRKNLLPDDTTIDAGLLPSVITKSRLAIRQPGAGSRLLLEDWLQSMGLTLNALNAVQQCRTETDSVTAVLTNEADICIGPRSLADMYQLQFFELVREDVDLIVDRKAWFEPAWQKLLAFCHSPAFQEKARQMAGYDVTHLGCVRVNGRG